MPAWRACFTFLNQIQLSTFVAGAAWLIYSNYDLFIIRMSETKRKKNKLIDLTLKCAAEAADLHQYFSLISLPLPLFFIDKC